MAPAKKGVDGQSEIAEIRGRCGCQPQDQHRGDGRVPPESRPGFTQTMESSAPKRKARVPASIVNIFTPKRYSESADLRRHRARATILEPAAWIGWWQIELPKLTPKHLSDSRTTDLGAQQGAAPLLHGSAP
jgi:hypothetical protein